jgi:hypothetical protein
MSASNQTYLGATQNLVSSCSGSVQPILGSQVSLSAAQGTYYPIQSGQIISVGTLTAPLVITLPPVATSAGHQFTVVCSNGAAVNQLITISAQTACMRGVAFQGAAAALDANQALTGRVSGAASTSLTLLGNGYRAGDRVELKCDGTSWCVMGWSNIAIGTAVFLFVA